MKNANLDMLKYLDIFTVETWGPGKILGQIDRKEGALEFVALPENWMMKNMWHFQQRETWLTELPVT